MAKKSKRKQSKQTAPWYKKWQVWVVVSVVVTAVTLLWIWQQNVPPPLPDNYERGIVTSCLAGPAFIADLPLDSPTIDTSQQIAHGLVIREPYEEGRYYQHETWNMAGNLGPFAYDDKGDIYVGPVPLVSLQVNPTEEQNWIYRVDSQTAVMSKYLELPWPLPPTGQNPYGVIGLTYDCDTGSLYASSLAGSTAQEVVGAIYQIDLATSAIINQLDNLDTLGLGIFNGSAGKRLYYGLARSSDVYSIGLDANTGAFYGEPRFEFSLATQPGGSFDNAQRIQFTADDRMIVKGGEFSFSLQVASEPQRNVYVFQYETDSDGWTFLNVQKE